MTAQVTSHPPFQKSVEPLCGRISLTERAQLLRWVRARTSPHRLVVRSRIILLAAEGMSIRRIAARLHVSPNTVRLWCDRFHRRGLSALEREAPGRGRRPGMPHQVILAVIRAMQHPPEGGGVWTTRALAAHIGTSASTVWRVWKRTGLGPSSTREDVRLALAQVISETP
jgi:transposase